MFILKTIGGDKIKITEEEHKNILMAKTDVITLSSGITIRKNMIAIIFPESRADEIETRKKQQTGILHDGTRVVRHFGRWVLAGDIVPDDNGNYQHIEIDQNYYPGVATDCVATEKEYEQVSKVGDYARITGYNLVNKRTSDKGLTKIL